MKKIYLLIPLFLFFGVTTVAFGATPTITGTPLSFTTAGPTTSWTVSGYTMDTTGSNRALWAVVSRNTNSNVVTGCSWNGTAMTNVLAIALVNAVRFDVFYLANPDTGSNDFICTWGSNATDPGLLAFSTQDTAQSSPIDVSGSSSQAGGTSDSKEITTTIDNDLVVAFIAGFNGLNPTVTGGAGQTDFYVSGTPFPHFTGSSKPKAAAGAVTMSFSWSGGQSDDMGSMGIKYLAPPAPPAAAPQIPFFMPIFGVIRDFFAPLVFAKQVPVSVNEKTIKAEVVNIAPNTVIDIATPFTETEKTNVKTGLTLTAKESEVLDKVLAKEPLKGMSEARALISVFKKLYYEKPLSGEEVKYIFGFDGKKKTMGEVIRYLSRKKLKDL